MQKLQETTWANYHYGLPKEKPAKRKAVSWSLYSKTGQPIALNTTYPICMAKIKAIGAPNNTGLKPKPNY